jgi:O-antigen/teichoic acid export membrane protein
MNRFDLVNLVQAFGAVLQWLGSIAVIAAGGGLVEVIILFVVTRYLLAGVLYLYFRHAFTRSAGTEEYAPPAGDETSPIRKLLAFGGWMSVAQLVGPVLLLLERVIISRTSSPEWITYFVVPQDTLLKLVIIPMSLASTLYSIVSARWGTPGGVTFSKNLYDDAVRYSWYVLIPVVFIGAVFSEEILRLWLGETFAARSGGVFTVIVCGVLFHGLAQLPNVVIIGSGKPRVPAGLLLVEFLPYLALCVWFTSLWGVLGTALAWFARVVVETLYLFIRARGLWGDGETGTGYAFLWKGPVLLACCGLPVLALKSAGMGTAVSALTLALFLLAYGVALWFVVFEGEDRRRMLAVFRPAGS